MTKLVKLITVFSILIFVSGCNASSSDAKKVVVKAEQTDVKTSVSTVTTTPKDAPNKLSEEPAKKEGFVEGKHYVEIFPEMSTDAPSGKVEVIELMWLGCPHCYELEPTIEEYKKNLPDYVDFKQIPAMLNPSWATDAYTYFIAEILDPKGDKHLITKIFQAMHEQKRRLSKPAAAKRFFLQQGISEADYNNAKNSLAFKVKVKRAQEISAASQAQSVPTLIINGKYRTSPYIAGSNERLLQIVEMLTRQEKK